MSMQLEGLLPREQAPVLDRSLDQIAMELTVYCNLQCKMCSVWELREHGVPLELAKKLLQQARTLGAKTFTPCGAESFMRKDFLDIVDYAQELGFENQEIVTNGTMLTDKHFDRLEKCPSVQLHVSIDGPQPVQDDLRGEGVYEKCVTNARKAMERGVRIGLSGVIMRETLATLTHLIDLACELGIKEVSYQPFQTEISGPDKALPRFHLLHEDPQRITRALEQLQNYADQKGVKIFTLNLFGVIPDYLTKGQRPIPPGGCYLPSKFLLVDWRGDVYPCFFMRSDADRMGNVHRDELTELWHSLHHKQLQVLALTERCPGCLAACSDVETFDHTSKANKRSLPIASQAGGCP